MIEPKFAIKEPKSWALKIVKSKGYYRITIILHFIVGIIGSFLILFYVKNGFAFVIFIILYTIYYPTLYLNSMKKLVEESEKNSYDK